MQTARNAFGYTALEVASPECRQFMKEFRDGGEVAFAQLTEELEREAAELFSRLEAERAQAERQVPLAKRS